MKIQPKFWKQNLDFISWSKQKFILVRVYLVYALIIGAMYAGDSMLDTHRDKSTAYAIAKNYVAEKLISPSTAHFPPMSDEDVYIDYLGDHRFSISGYLVSRNSFGNENRSDYTCVVREVGAGEWTYENIFFK